MINQTRLIFERYLPRAITICLFSLLAAISAFAGTAELLSDDCIADVTAGAGDTVITAFYETPSTAYIDNEPRWWGDMDGIAGFGSACAGNTPGFVVTNIPYNDFQYDSFKYAFKSQADVDRFLNDLPVLDGQPVNVLSTDYIKSNPGADHAFSGDGRAPRVQEIIITTNRKLNGNFVRSHNGQVITQNVRFDLNFLPPYARSYTVEKAAEDRTKKTGRLVPAPAFRNYNRYEWAQGHNTGMQIVRNADGTFYYTQSVTRTYNFGAIFLEGTSSGDEPVISPTGHVVVPPHTAYLRNTIYNDLHVFSPAVGLTIGLAPPGDVDPESGEIYPDLDKYQELGVLDIRNLHISLKGGNDIYIYANEDLDVCR